MKCPSLGVVLLSSSALSSCIQAPSVPDATRNVVPNGFICTAAPSEAYGPGYVYRLDQAGSELLVTDPGSSARTFVYSAVLPAYDATLSRGAGLNIALRAPAGSAPIADVSASGSNSSHVAFGDGRFVLMSDVGLDQLLKEINAQVTPKPGSKYFVVRDTIQAKSIDLKISQQDEVKLGGQARLANIFSANPSVQIKRQDTLNLTATFNSPLNVCIRAVEILPKTSADGTTPVTEGDTWQITDQLFNQAATATLFSN